MNWMIGARCYAVAVVRVRRGSHQGVPGSSWWRRARVEAAPPFLPLCGQSSALGEGKDSPVAHSDKSLLARRREPRWTRRSISGGARGPSVLRKIGAQDNTSAAVGGERSRALIGYRRAAVKPQQMGCRWGCERRAPLPVNPLVRPVDRVVARASSKLAPCANVREFRGKSRARLIPET